MISKTTAKLILVFLSLIIAGNLSAGSMDQQIKIQRVGVYTVPLVLKSGDFKITITKMYNGSYGNGYFCEAIVKNTGNKESVFDPNELELVNETGITFFYATRDGKEPPPDMNDLITKITLKSGRATEGRLLFPTTAGKAYDDKLTLFWKDVKIDTVREREFQKYKEFVEFFNLIK